MRLRCSSAIVAASIVASTTLGAQSGREFCGAAPTGSPATYQTCQAVVDVFDYLAPQLAAVLDGGTQAPGLGASSSGAYRVTFSVRANLLQGSLPNLGSYSPPSSFAPTTVEADAARLTLPVVDASLHLFDGVTAGRTKVGGVDLLLSGAYLRAFSGGSTSLKLRSGSFRVGYGARVTLLEEGAVSPGLSVSWVRRDLPEMNLSTRYRAGTLIIEDMKVKTSGWRVAGSKSLAALRIAAGVGQDGYESSAAIPFASYFGFTTSQNVRRTVYYGTVSTNMRFATLFADLGGVSGGKIETFNAFDGPAPGASRWLGSLGARIGL
jgi:hypothetical protein